MANAMKVLYIGGSGRSGTTIIGNILGSARGFVHVGELRYIFDRGLIQNRLCGCSAPFRRCSVWNEVLLQAFGSANGVDAEG